MLQPMALVTAGSGLVPADIEAIAFSTYFILTALMSWALSSIAPYI
jgi:hypothetical protein